MKNGRSDFGLVHLQRIEQAVAIGDVGQAEREIVSALKECKKLGLLFDSVVQIAHSLAQQFCLARRYHDAERLYLSVLSARENLFGADHFELIDSLKRLTVIMRETRSDSEAQRVAFRAGAIAMRRSA